MVVILWQLDLQLPVLSDSVPITTNVVSFNPVHGEVYSIQLYVISLSVTCDRSVVFSIQLYVIGLSVTCNRSVVFSGYSFSSTNKTDRHDITEILLKVVLNTINQNYITYINIIKSYPHRSSHCNFRIIYHQKHKTLFKWISNGCQEGFSPFAIGICCLPC